MRPLVFLWKGLTGGFQKVTAILGHGKMIKVVSELSKLEILLRRCVLPGVDTLSHSVPPWSVFLSLGPVEGLGISRKGLVCGRASPSPRELQFLPSHACSLPQHLTSCLPYKTGSLSNVWTHLFVFPPLKFYEYKCDLNAAFQGSGLSLSETWSVLFQARPPADAGSQMRQIRNLIILRGVT